MSTSSPLPSSIFQIKLWSSLSSPLNLQRIDLCLGGKATHSDMRVQEQRTMLLAYQFWATLTWLLTLSLFRSLESSTNLLVETAKSMDQNNNLWVRLFFWGLPPKNERKVALLLVLKPHKQRYRASKKDRPSTGFRKLMDAYCSRLGLQASQARVTRFDLRGGWEWLGQNRGSQCERVFLWFPLKPICERVPSSNKQAHKP